MELSNLRVYSIFNGWNHLKFTIWSLSKINSKCHENLTVWLKRAIKCIDLKKKKWRFFLWTTLSTIIGLRVPLIYKEREKKFRTTKWIKDPIWNQKGAKTSRINWRRWLLFKNSFSVSSIIWISVRLNWVYILAFRVCVRACFYCMLSIRNDDGCERK